MSVLGFSRGLSSYRLTLTITHVPTGYKVEFPAFLEMFSDAFTQQWNSEDVYGRMDPIATFINTRRALSIAWNVPAESYLDAQNNLQKVNTLMSFMYPLYEDSGAGGATAINQAPLLRIKFGNLIQNAQTGDGILGYVNGFTFDPELSEGMFYQEGPRGRSSTGAEYYPKTFRLNTEINVLHEHSLGFRRSDSSGKSFSYRAPGVDNASYPYVSNLRPTIEYASANLQVPPAPASVTPPPTTDQATDPQPGTSINRPQPASEAQANPESVARSIQPSNIAVSAAQKAMGVGRNTGPTLAGDAAAAFSAYRNR